MNLQYSKGIMVNANNNKGKSSTAGLTAASQQINSLLSSSPMAGQTSSARRTPSHRAHGETGSVDHQLLERGLSGLKQLVK